MSQTPRVDRERLRAAIDAACYLDTHKTALAHYSGDAMGLLPVARAYYQASTGALLLHLDRGVFPLEDVTLLEFPVLPDYIVEHLLNVKWVAIHPLAPLAALAQSAE